MAEHVGQSQIDTYARSLFGVLKPGGLVLNHAISLMRPEEDPLADEFTMRYVFPDGEPLLLSRVQLAFERARFHTEHIEGFTTDYAVTLRHWHDRLDEHLVEAERLAGAAAAARLAALSARRAPRLRRRLHVRLPAEGAEARLTEASVRRRARAAMVCPAMRRTLSRSRPRGRGR